MAYGIMTMREFIESHGDINPRCAGNIAKQLNPDAHLGDRFDMDYEDQCRDRCGL